MRIYSDSKVSDFLHSIRAEQTVGFLNGWNERRNKREKIYISYDSTNKNCQSGDIDMVEFGHPKEDAGLPVFHYSVAYDTANREPLFYEQYPGSINDVSQLRYAVDKAYSYGYRKLGFILDLGYFSRANLAYMDKNDYSFIIMVKGMKKFIRGIILGQMGDFENKREKYIDRYDVYGTTVSDELYEGDEQTRYIHVYYSDVKALSGKQQMKEKIRRMKAFLDSCEGKEKEFGPGFEEYFYLHYEKDGKTFAIAEERTDVIEQELSLCGYFAIIDSSYKLNPFTKDSNTELDKRLFVNAETAEWFRERKIKAVGFGDGVSIENCNEDVKPFRDILLAENIIFIEVLKNLEELKRDVFFLSFTALPIKGLDSSPVHAYAIEGLAEFS